MNKKGLRLVLIIVIGFIILTLINIIIPDSYDITGSNENIIAVAPFNFLFGFITPLIFITQFRNKEFYKYFGLFLIFINVVSLAIVFTFDTEIYSILRFISIVITFIGLTGFVVYVFKKDELKKAYIYLFILILNLLYVNPIVLDSVTIQRMSSISKLVFLYLIPIILSFTSLIYKLILVMYESKVQSKEDMELL